MSYTRYDYLLDRQTELQQDIQIMEAYPELDDHSKKLNEYKKEQLNIQIELDKIDAQEKH